MRKLIGLGLLSVLSLSAACGGAANNAVNNSNTRNINASTPVTLPSPVATVSNLNTNSNTANGNMNRGNTNTGNANATPRRTP